MRTVARDIQTKNARSAMLAKFENAVLQQAEAAGEDLTLAELEARAARLRSSYYGSIRREAVLRQRAQRAPNLSALVSSI